MTLMQTEAIKVCVRVRPLSFLARISPPANIRLMLDPKVAGCSRYFDWSFCWLWDALGCLVLSKVGFGKAAGSMPRFMKLCASEVRRRFSAAGFAVRDWILPGLI